MRQEMGRSEGTANELGRLRIRVASVRSPVSVWSESISSLNRGVKSTNSLIIK